VLVVLLLMDVLESEMYESSVGSGYDEFVLAETLLVAVLVVWM